MPGPSKPQIKVNALIRLSKEYDEYVKEETTLKAQLTALENANPKDEYEIRRKKQILEETKRVKSRVAQSLKEHSAEVRKLGGLRPEDEKLAKQGLELAAART